MNQDQNVTSETATADDTEQWIESTATAMLEEISTSFLGRRPDVNERNNRRIPFSDDVRVCPADSLGVPKGPSVMTSGRNLSLHGISVCCPQSFEVDTCLTMEFAPPIGENGRVVTMLAQVRHVNAEDDQTILGCEFLETLNPW